MNDIKIYPVAENYQFPIKSWRRYEVVQQVRLGMDFDKIAAMLESWTVVDEYVIALHDKDINKTTNQPVEPHIHAYVTNHSPVQTCVILNAFNKALGSNVVAFNHLNKIKGRWVNAVAYASHRNAPGKHPYYLDDDFRMVANFDTRTAEVAATAPVKQTRLIEIDNLIREGKVTRSNLYTTDLLSGLDFAAFDSKIESLLCYYEARNLRLSRG